MNNRVARITLIVWLLLALASARAADADDGGIWKAFVPDGTVGEFGSHDPVGLIAGKQILADCSLNWRDQHDRLYCFSSGTSLVHFLDQPQTFTQRARQAWTKVCAEATRPRSCG